MRRREPSWSHRRSRPAGRSNSEATASGGRTGYCRIVGSSRHRRSSRHCESALNHSMASNGASHASQRSSGFAESGCAAMPNPPSLATSSTTSRASPPSGYGGGDIPSAA